MRDRRRHDSARFHAHGIVSVVGEPQWARRLTKHRGPHTHAHVDRERRLALFLVLSGLARVAVWTVIMLAFVAGLGLVVGWFASVKFVALLSILALILTDFGQVCSSLAQLSAAQGHHDAEATRRAVHIDTVQIETDLQKLAELQPGPNAWNLAKKIAGQIKGSQA